MVEEVHTCRFPGDKHNVCMGASSYTSPSEFVGLFEMVGRLLNKLTNLLVE
jgi:hypothetical protein